MGLVHNPAAGGHSAARLGGISTWLEQRGVDVSLVATRPGDGGFTVDLPNDDPDGLWVLGGDGTARIVVASLLRSRRFDIPVGLVPMGTANVLAREFGLKRRALDALWSATQARRVRNLDIGGCDDHPFLMSAGFGFDAEAVARVNPTLKRGTGRVEYAASCAAAIMAYPRQARWRVTSGPLANRDAGWILVASSSRYAGGFRISRGSCFDGAFEIFHVTTRSSLALTGMLARGLLGRGWPVAARLGREDTLTLEGDGAIQLDGDLWKPRSRRIVIRMRPETLPVYVGTAEG